MWSRRSFLAILVILCIELDYKKDPKNSSMKNINIALKKRNAIIKNNRPKMILA
jgi:hypothetical protein